jgi:deoxyribodipyrimidine photolyase-related protein
MAGVDAMKQIIYIPFDHLHRDFGALKGADPATDLIAMVESARMTTGRNWHKERLFFLISSARHFAQLLETEGFTVEYVKAPTTVDGLTAISKKYPKLPIVCAEPSSFRQFEALKDYGVSFVENDFFLTPRTLFASWAGGQKTFVMDNFYKKQRTRLNILMDGTEPEGGAWNYDKENRLPPPKKYEGPAYLEFKRDELDVAVAKELDFTPTTTWATTRKGALKGTEEFYR